MMATTGQREMLEKIGCSDFTVELHEVVIGCNFTKPFKDLGNFEFPAFGGICYFFRVIDYHMCTFGSFKWANIQFIPGVDFQSGFVMCCVQVCKIVTFLLKQFVSTPFWPTRSATRSGMYLHDMNFVILSLGHIFLN